MRASADSTGPDLIDTFKTGPAYYARLLADAAVPPTDAVIVDDSLDALAWAAEVGACPVRVGAPRWHITSLADMPVLLAQLEGMDTHSAEQPPAQV